MIKPYMFQPPTPSPSEEHLRELVSLSKAWRAMSEGCTKKVDDVIRSAINAEIGESWSLADMKGRLQSVRRVDQPFQTFLLDGSPILELWDPEMTTERRGDSTHMVLTQQYRNF